jgi:hypothetical protein
MRSTTRQLWLWYLIIRPLMLSLKAIRQPLLPPKSGSPKQPMRVTQKRKYSIEPAKRFSCIILRTFAENVERREFTIDQWVRIRQIDEIPSEWYFSVTKGLVCAQHANGCFHKVLRDDSTAPTYLEQLDQLAAFQPIYVDNEERLATYPKEFIARFHAPQGDEQEVKDTLRTYIKRNIDILFGDDPLNGWQGYQGLAIYLMFAGQNADCLVAWLLIVSYDGEEINPGTTFQKQKGTLWQECEGCDTSFPYPDHIYMCRECHYTEFDEPCFTKLCEGNLERNICDKVHGLNPK